MNTTYNDSRRWVEDEWFLILTNVSKDDFGLYHCMLRSKVDQSWTLVRLGLNLQGPFFQDLWEMYQWNTIIGCAAFGGFLILCLLFWLFYHFRWVEEKPEDIAPQLNGKMEKSDFSNGGFYNKAYVDDGGYGYEGFVAPREVFHRHKSPSPELQTRVSHDGSLITEL